MANFKPMKPVKIEGGFDFPQLAYLEGANQTFNPGTPLVASGGYLVAGTSPSPSGLVGLSLAAGANLATAGASLPYPNLGQPLCVPTRPDIIFEGTLDVAAGNHALAATDIYAKYGIAQDPTSGNWYINQADTTNTRVVVVGLVQDNPIGTVSARVYFKFLLSATIYN